jgi:succinate dehydrogenase hydrophobic anchor subunit
MLENPPREKKWISWLWVAAWSLLIFVTIPLARLIQDYVSRHWGRTAFTYTVLATIMGTLLAAVIGLYRSPSTNRRNYLWLLSIAVFFSGYTYKLGQKSPEEAIHFVQYGVLGVLVFRALRHTRQDVSIYFAAALLCGSLGTVDEFVQWLTPGRFWGLRDIWINFVAAALVQLAIAKGLQPKLIAGRPSRANLRFLCRLVMIAAVLLGLSLLNTPDRIAWVAERVPGLDFLGRNESVMAEYGYLYEDPEIGVFRSRLAPEILHRTDLERGKSAAKLLDLYKDRSGYRAFLEIYTPVNDPFLHEARVHLFSRDQNFSWAKAIEVEPETKAKFLTTAFSENRIMEKYFPHTLQHSEYRWSRQQRTFAAKHRLPDKLHESWVSRHLFTRVSEAQVGLFFALLILVLAMLHLRLGKQAPRG